MRTKIFTFVVLIMLACLFSVASAQVPQMINYQGMLTDTLGNRLNGSYNMTFSIYDTSTGGVALWTETQNGVSVEDGVFNVLLGSATPIPFSVFNGKIRYLGIKIGTDPEMTPRKSIVSVAYAYRAAMGDNDWTFRITDTADTTLMTGGAWGIARYGNTLYGNKDSTHVNLGVACTTGTSGEQKMYCTVGGGRGNTAGWDQATVAGGSNNRATTTAATIGGGVGNTASGMWATVAGGYENTASELQATIGGGSGNTASGSFATVGGGHWNAATGSSATVGGGSGDTASGFLATVGGGNLNKATNSYATVGGGAGNDATAQCATVGGGAGNDATAQYATIGGGQGNRASGDYATIGGGYNNLANGVCATIPGGYSDTVSGDYSFATGNLVKVTSTADYTLAFGSNFTTSASHAVIFHDTGTPIKVGIGTTSPGYSLDVAGALNLNKGISSGGALYVNGFEALWYNGTFFSWGQAGTANYFEDEVGIGITAPTEMLDVNGTARLRSMGSSAGTDVVVDANGKLWKKSSSKRYKEDIRILQTDPEEVLKLQPVRFKWITTQQEDIGLIAEDVQEVIPDLVIYDKEGKPDGVKYDRVSLYLLEMVKAQQLQIEALKGEIERMKSGSR